MNQQSQADVPGAACCAFTDLDGAVIDDLEGFLASVLDDPPEVLARLAAALRCDADDAA